MGADELKISISGIRGIWKENLTFEILCSFINAFTSYLKKRNAKKVLIGRDGRSTGEIIKNLTVSIFTSCGLDVYDADIIPTPSILLGVREFDFDGGLVISASHNPVCWNALKLVKKGGTFTSQSDIEEIKSYLDRKIEVVDYTSTGKYVNYQENVEKLHIEKILSYVNVELIKSMQFKVVLDPVNSAGSFITEKLLKTFGCEVIKVNGEVTGSFAREPEPTLENLSHLKKIVRENDADVGFAQDPDADRLVLVDENGNVLSEELTCAICMDYILSRERGDIVVNLSTSMINDFIADKYGVKCYRTKVGEVNVVEGIFKYQAIAGGEGNGGVIYPKVNIARDSLVGIALVLDFMANLGKSLSTIVSKYPTFYMKKKKYEKNVRLEYLKGKLLDYFSPFHPEVNEEDGVRFSFKDGKSKCWFHFRFSNTENVLRVIGESESKDILDKHFANIEGNIILGV